MPRALVTLSHVQLTFAEFCMGCIGVVVYPGRHWNSSMKQHLPGLRSIQKNRDTLKAVSATVRCLQVYTKLNSNI